MNLELKLPPPYDESNYPFLLDNKILEQIGFAVGCFENYRLLTRKSWIWTESSITFN